MTRFISRLQKALAIASIVLALASGSRSLAQMPQDSTLEAPILQPQSAFSGNDLANLVAPIALYPDALLGQVLVACTYPLEVVEAQQWLQQNANLHNRELIEAAQQRNWDPSVQALVAFPDVLALLNRNISWTTDVGNAFLGQQSDVMSAIQSLRAQARGNGQLESTPQLSVNRETQGDRSAIEILPADPRTMYVPSYNPSIVWGTPAEGSYPELPYTGSGFGSLFGTIANLAGLLPGFGGLLGPKSWGWALSWLAQALFVNNSFFSDFGFHNFDGGSFNGNGRAGGSSLWVHNAHHRHGVPYGNSMVAGMYGGGGGNGQARQGGDGWRTFGRGTRGISAPEPRRPFTEHPSTGRDSFQRDNRTDYRKEGTRRGENWRTFGNSARTAPAGQSDRAFSQPPRTTERLLQPNRGSGRDPYFGNSAANRARSFPAERSFASGNDGFRNQGIRGSERSRTATSSSSSWKHALHLSKSRVPSQHGSSSYHAPKSPHFSAPKFKAPHSSKSHGGGHSSGGHSGKRSHH